MGRYTAGTRGGTRSAQRTGMLLAACLCCSLALSGSPGLADDLAWLEAPHDERALAWARERTLESEQELRSSTSYRTVADELRSLLAADAGLPDVTLLGGNAVRLLRDVAHPQGVLQAARRDRDGLPSSWGDVLDVGALATRDSPGYELRRDRLAASCLPPAYERCLLRLSPGGGDPVEIREFDLASGRFVPGGYAVPSTLTRGGVWLDRDHIVLTHALGDEPTLAGGVGSRVRLWRRGDPLESAQLAYEARSTDRGLWLGAVGTGDRRRVVIVRAVDASTFDVDLLDASGKLERVPLPAKLRFPGLLATTQRHLIVQVGEPFDLGGRRVAAGSFVSFDATPGVPPSNRLQVVFEPQPDEFVTDQMTGVAATASSVHLVVSRKLRARHVVAVSGARGWRIQPRQEENVGTSLAFVGADPAGDDIVLLRSGFLSPGRLDLVRPGREPRTIGAESAAFDAGRQVVELRTARSRDGTLIDYYLVRPRTVRAAEPVPTLMTGYGAFGVPVSPAYLDSWVGGRAFALWFARGGALVVAAIRGGGEHGAPWHAAARREKRQRSYDDFIAVAESLVNTGFARPDRLGVFGTSNGGLLAAVVGTQRPDLFGAVVSDVPLADMLRYPLMGMGPMWVDEYGDPRDAAMADVLRRYSPVHNVVAGQRYPSFMVTTSTNDTRVGPGHARKLAARLLDVGAEVRYIEADGGGHDVSDSLSSPDLMALRMTFLIDRLMPLAIVP